MVAISRLNIDPTLQAIDAQIEKAENAKPFRPYLGMSSIGRECERELWFGFRWASKKMLDAASIRRFEDGHRSEAVMIERLRSVPGIKLHTEDPRKPGRQIACVYVGGHFRGHLDGIILGLLQAPKTAHCWEHKATNEKKQAQLTKLKEQYGEKQALAHWDGVYYAQHIIYMHAQDLTRGYLTCDSPGARTTISVRTDADPEAAEALIEKAKRIITAPNPLPRISERPDWFSCKWCDHREVCREGAIPQANCRTCIHATPELDGDGRWSCAKYLCDIPVEVQRTGGACPSHLFLPALMPWDVRDADEDAGWIEYANGLRNGPGGYASREIAANAGLCAADDPIVAGFREKTGAEVVG